MHLSYVLKKKTKTLASLAFDTWVTGKISWTVEFEIRYFSKIDNDDEHEKFCCRQQGSALSGVVIVNTFKWCLF